jgi:hypothetical protein
VAYPGKQVPDSRSTIEEGTQVACWRGELQGVFKRIQGLCTLAQGSFGLCAQNVDGEEAAKKGSGLGKLLQFGQEHVRLGRSVLGQQQAGKGEILRLPGELRRISQRAKPRHSGEAPS